MKTNKIEAKASKKETTQVTNLNPTSKEEKKIKKIKKSKEVSSKKLKKVKEEVKQQQTANIVEEVISKRQVKWLYPEDCTDTLSRKAWRQKERGKLRKKELAVARIKDTNSKEYKEALKDYQEYMAKVLKPGQIA